MGVLYANNASTSLASAITNSATSLSVAAGNGALFPTISGSDYFYVTVSSSSGAAEIVKVTATGGDTFTVVRGQDGTAAQTFSAGDAVELRLTKAVLDALKTDALTNPSITGGYTESIYAVSGTTPVLSPANGSIQTWTLTASSTPTAGTWAAGQSLTLMIDDGSAYTINWASMPVTWKTNAGVAPTLNTTDYTVIQLWKVGTTIYGARVGDA
jgi:hypothetical protein